MVNCKINRLVKIIISLAFLLVASCFVSENAHAEVTNADQPNSWRYKDGQLIDTLEGSLKFSGGASLQANAIAHGIDVSEWQGDINWEAVKNSGMCDFAIIRCGFVGQGAARADYKWERNASECERLGIPYGVYVYSYATSWDDLNSLVSYTKGWLSGHYPTYPVFIDMEDSSTTWCGRETLTSFASSFCQQIESAGFVAGVYANTNWFTNILYGDWLDNYVKWVAQYNYVCTYSGKYSIWQYSSSGYVPGISGSVDVNYLYDEIEMNEERFKGVYDYDFYTAANADVRDAFGGNRYWTFRHFLMNGMNEGRRSSAIFDQSYYKSQYADLQDAYGNDNKKYFTHFLEYGMSEGRVASDLFDCAYYKAKNADIASAYGNDNPSCYYHFISTGMNEGREASATFDLTAYYNRYQDLRRAFGGDFKSYYLHYVRSGASEGRSPVNCNTLQNAIYSFAGVDYSVVYDGIYYATNNIDVKNAYAFKYRGDLINDAAIIQHFAQCGINEGRQANQIFNVASYYNRYQDLRRSFRGNISSYYWHFINHGYNEGRSAVDCATLQDPVSSLWGRDYSLVYDGNLYMNNYADLKNAFTIQKLGGLVDDVSLLEHFVNSGMNEGRQAKATFNVNSYYNNYEDLRLAFGQNWKSYYFHYLDYGYWEGRGATATK